MCIVLGTANRLSIQGNVLELLLHMVHEDLRERVVGIFAAGHDVHAAGLRLALYGNKPDLRVVYRNVLRNAL